MIQYTISGQVSPSGKPVLSVTFHGPSGNLAGEATINLDDGFPSQIGRDLCVQLGIDLEDTLPVHFHVDGVLTSLEGVTVDFSFQALDGSPINASVKGVILSKDASCGFVIGSQLLSGMTMIGDAWAATFPSDT